MKTFIIITFSIFSLSLYSQNDKPKRGTIKLEIAANETQQYATDIPEGPYFVKEKILQIYCGEKIFVECEIQGDSISKMKVVEKNINPEKTIVIDFTQDSENRKQIRTELNVKNPFSKTLRYDAFMFTPMSNEWRSTSIVPVYAKIESFETWPHSIISLALQNWRFE